MTQGRFSRFLCCCIPWFLFSGTCGAQVTIPNSIGAGLRSRPAYDGSASQRADLVPSVRWYGNPAFVRTTQGILEGGARLALTPDLTLGAQLAYEGGRAARESDFLRDHTVPDIHPGASIGLHVEWDQKIGPMPVVLLARGRQNVDRDRGSQFDLRATGVFYGGDTLALAAFFQGTWADTKAARSYYGVDASATALPTYDPERGQLFVGAGLIGRVALSREWTLPFSIEARRLQGDAARSPIAERRTNVYATLGASYQF